MSFENVLDTKLGLIKSQKDILHGALDDYAEKVTSIGKTTLESGSRDLDTFKKVNSQLEGLLEFLFEKSLEVEDIKKRHHKEALKGSTPPRHSSTNHSSKQAAHENGEIPYDCDMNLRRSEDGNVKTEAKSTTDKVLETTDSNGTHDYQSWESSEIFQPRNETSQQCMGVKVDSCCMKGTDHVSLIDVQVLLQQMESKFVEKLSEAEMKITKDTEEQFKKIEANISKLKQTSSHTVQGTNDRIKQVERQSTEVMQAVSKVEGLDKRLKKVEGRKKTDAETIENLAGDIQAMKSQCSNNKKQNSAKVNSLEKQMETLTAQSEIMQTSLEDVRRLRNDVEDLHSRMGMLADNKDLVDVMKISSDTSRSLDQLSSRVDHVESFVKDSVSYREREENKRRELEDRILTVEENRRKDMELYTKKMDEVESQYKEVCQIVDNRVTPLRRLQHLLNEYHKTVEKREELSDRLDDLTQQVKDVSDKVLSIDTKTSKSPVGFTAYYPSVLELPDTGSTVTDFKTVIYNEGNRFFCHRGTFVAPQDGLYITSITIRQNGEGRIDMCVVKKNKPNERGENVCKAATHVSNTSCCGFAVVSLKATDMLYAKVNQKSGNPGLSPYSSFSCVLVG